MSRIESTVDIRATPAAVWAVLSDVIHWHEWTPTVTSTRALDTAELAVGHRFEIHQPKLRPALWTITEVKPGKCFRWTSETLGLRMIADHVVEPASGDSTRVVLRFEFQGMLGPLVGYLTKKLVTQYVSTEAASLRARLERG